MDAPGIRDQRGLVCCHELPVTVGVAYPGGANPNVHTKNPTRALIVAASALIWLAGSLLFQWAAPQTGFMPGIDIIYPPAGLRTLLLIVGGGWAAAGLSIANLAMIPDALGLDSLASRLLFAAYTGVAPYVAMIGSFRMLGIARSLRNLSPRHLPVLCFGIALGSSVLHVAGFCVIGSIPWPGFFTAAAAMTLGDFTGCLIVILLALGAIKMVRMLQAA